MPRKKAKKDNETVVKVPKKRGRKPKKKLEGEENIVLVKKPKKRGRKPKGGKIIKTLIEPNKNQKIKPNVILHLKCSLKDIEQNNESISVLKYNPNVENIQSYAFNNTNKLDYEVIHKSSSDNKLTYMNNVSMKGMGNKSNEKINKNTISNNVENTPHIKEIYEKLKLLERNLHLNNISDKKSSCFWCT